MARGSLQIPISELNLESLRIDRTRSTGDRDSRSGSARLRTTSRPDFDELIPPSVATTSTALIASVAALAGCWAALQPASEVPHRQVSSPGAPARAGEDLRKSLGSRRLPMASNQEWDVLSAGAHGDQYNRIVVSKWKSIRDFMKCDESGLTGTTEAKLRTTSMAALGTLQRSRNSSAHRERLRRQRLRRTGHLRHRTALNVGLSLVEKVEWSQ